MAETDYLIVGGGTAGCALATRLKQGLPNAKVTILEAGTDEHKNPLIADLTGTFQLHFTDYEYKYSTVPQKFYDGRQVFNAGGKLLSGSSGVNYGMWTRGSRQDYDQWAKVVGDDRWSYDGLLPYFKKTETHHKPGDVDMSQHGTSGPIHTGVSTSREHPLKSAVIEAFGKATGLPWKVDANAGDPIGVAPYTENWREGKRQPSGVAYGLAGVNVVTSTVVRRIVIEDGVATGAELVNGKIIKANREVIVCCGALRSPQVLMLSGIGPKAELARFGIQQTLSNAAAESIGTNLSDHPAVPMFYKVKYPEQNVAAGAPGWNHPDYLLGMPVDMLVTSNHSNDAVKAALQKDGNQDVSSTNPYLHLRRGHSEMIPLYAASESPLTNLGLPFDGTVITAGVLLLLPTSRGTITLSSTDPKRDPLIDPNYFATETDRVIIRQAMRTNIAAFETSPLVEQIEGHFPPPGYEKLHGGSSDEDLDAYVKRVAVTWFHPSGTCAMGKVVDSECRVIGLEGLRVVDASVFPAPLAAHYQAPVYAVAEQMADIIIRQALKEDVS